MFSLFPHRSPLQIRDRWSGINLPNLVENILPTRGRADRVLTKSGDHTIDSVQLKKL